MAKKIIILHVSQTPITYNVQAAFWFPITIGMTVVPSTSAWTGASPAELAAIAAGTVLEELQNFQIPVGIASTEVKTILEQYWTNRNTQLAGVGSSIFYGVYDDSLTGWSA